MKFSFNSISTRADLILILASSVVLLSLVGLMQWKASDALRQELIDDNHTLAIFVSNNIDNAILQHKSLFLIEAGKDDLVTSVMNPDDSNYFIEDYLDELSTNFTGTKFYLFSFDGTPIIDKKTGVFLEKNPRVILNSINDKKIQIILAENNTAEAMIYFILPIVYGKHAEGAFVACLPFSIVFNKEAWLMAEDARINILAEGKRGIIVKTKQKIKDYISSSSMCSVIPVKIIIESPKDIIDVPVSNMQLSLGLIGVIIIGGAVIALNLTIKRMIILPILRLKKGVMGIAEDGWLAIPELKNDAEEISVLVKSFNSMQISLQERTAQLFQAEKMSSIGLLAAGVAHEINNPAGYVSSNIETLKRYVDGILEIINVCQDKVINSENPEKKLCETIGELKEVQSRIDFDYIKEDIYNLLTETMDGMNKISNIVAGLKDFSHVDKGDSLVDCDLNDLIDRTIRIVWNELKYKCTLHKNYCDLPLVQLHDGQISQVMLNLLINASQAITTQGNIYITTDLEGAFVRISISDDGHGISKEIINTIFDPFFTTKPVGQGTGLGLHICQKIIASHKGKILVESEEGVGTTFTVLLPVKQGAE